MTSPSRHQPFQTCGACKHAWATWQRFLLDPAIRLLGFQAVLTHPDLNLLIFEHRCGSSISILAKRLRHLLPPTEAPLSSTPLYGTEYCRGHCRFLADLEACDAPCVNALDRRLILYLLQIKRNGKLDAG